MPTILLVDNGSTRASATLRLRQIAEQLSRVSNFPIHPVSMRHADQISADQLHGVLAQAFTRFLDEKLSSGEHEFIVLPLFFGMSRALASSITDEVALLKDKYGGFDLRLADVIYPLPEGDPDLVKLLHDHVKQVASQQETEPKNVVLVDHGSPMPQITEVRENIAKALQEMLGPSIRLEQAVMQRREDKEYDFNGPLLEQWLGDKAAQGVEQVIVAQMFFLPGRHAGAGGDIETICNTAMQQYPDLSVMLTPLVGDHSMLISILHSRLIDCLNRPQ